MSGVIRRWRPYLLSIALHAVLVLVIVVLGARSWRDEAPAPVALAIEAVAVDRKDFAALERASRPPPVPQSASAPAPAPEPTPAPPPEKTQPPKPQPEKKDTREQQRRVEEDAKRRLEAETKRRAEAEAKRRADEETKRRAEEVRIRAEREAALQRELANELAETQAAEAQRAAQARAASMSAQWAAAIQARVQRAWIRPPSARPGLDCRVFVTQAVGGTVLEARVGECNGDEAVRQSLQAAVFRASPLPSPPDPALFERNIELRFRPND